MVSLECRFIYVSCKKKSPIYDLVSSVVCPTMAINGHATQTADSKRRIDNFISLIKTLQKVHQCPGGLE